MLAEFTVPPEPVPMAPVAEGEATVSPQAGPPAVAAPADETPTPAAASSEPGDVGPEPTEAAASAAEEAATAPKPMRGPGGRALVRPLEDGVWDTVEEMVGQVNGHPIFADEFLLPIEDQIAETGRRASVQEFSLTTADVVLNRMRSLVIDYLLLAEAEAALTLEQKQGLRYALQYFTEQVQAQHGGSEWQARESIFKEVGLTLEEYIELEKDKELLRKLLIERIGTRVIVSWRDIQREYQRRFDEFNHPPSILISAIRLNTADEPERIAEVRARLEGGEPFEDVADWLEIPERGVWQSFAAPSGKPDSIDTPNPELKAAFLTLLKEGDIAGPFESGRLTWWIRVTEVHEAVNRDIYDPDVQRLLTTAIRQQRFEEEQGRYVDSLIAKGIMGDLDEMRFRLEEIARVRYRP